MEERRSRCDLCGVKCGVWWEIMEKDIHLLQTLLHYHQQINQWGGCGSGGRAGRPMIERSAVRILLSTCRSVLGQDTEPHIASSELVGIACHHWCVNVGVWTLASTVRRYTPNVWMNNGTLLSALSTWKSAIKIKAIIIYYYLLFENLANVL